MTGAGVDITPWVMILGKSSTLTSSASATPRSSTTSCVIAISFWQFVSDGAADGPQASVERGAHVGPVGHGVRETDQAAEAPRDAERGGQLVHLKLPPREPHVGVPVAEPGRDEAVARLTTAAALL